eukprot:jgi/Mesvir1/28035/Mv04641-RA.1
MAQTCLSLSHVGSRLAIGVATRCIARPATVPQPGKLSKGALASLGPVKLFDSPILVRHCIKRGISCAGPRRLLTKPSLTVEASAATATANDTPVASTNPRNDILWGVLFLACAIQIATGPSQSTNVALFIDGMMETLQLTRGAVSSIYTMSSLIASATIPFLGAFVDKHGTRTSLLIATALYCASLAATTGVTSPSALFAVFVLHRVMGIGGLYLVAVTVVNQHWGSVGRRGFAQGVSGAAFYVGALGIIPTLSRIWIANYGWHQAYWRLALVVLALLVPFGLFFRTTPCWGMGPEGGNVASAKPASATAGVGAPSTGVTAAGADAEDDSWEFEEATKSWALRAILVGTFFMSLVGSGMTFNSVGLLREAGFPLAQMGRYFFLPLGVSGAVAMLASGAFLDFLTHLPVPASSGAKPVAAQASGRRKRGPSASSGLEYIVMAASPAFFMAAVLLSVRSTSLMKGLVFGSTLGAALGVLESVTSIIFATWFGERCLGRLSGLSRAFLIAGTAAGPTSYGLWLDTVGSYRGLMQWFCAPSMLLLTIIFFAFLRKPARKTIAS